LTDSGNEKGFLDKAKDVAGGLAEKAKPVIDKAGEKAQPAIEKAKPALDKAGEKAQPALDKAKPAFDKAGQAATGLFSKARVLFTKQTPADVTPAEAEATTTDAPEATDATTGGTADVPADDAGTDEPSS
jgi:hypothetical protein